MRRCQTTADRDFDGAFSGSACRRLIVVVLVVGAALGWMVRAALIQRNAVAAIESYGGHVIYDWDRGEGPYVVEGEPWVPRWLMDRIGVDYFGHVTEVTLFQAGADEAAVHLGHFDRLQRLAASGPSFSDAGLAHLKRLSSLSCLSLDGTPVSDAGLVHLERLANLSDLFLVDTQVTDAGLLHLRGLTNVSCLGLSCSQITDAGLVHMKDLINLSILRLDNTRVSDVKLLDRKVLNNLSILDLSWSHVTDAGLATSSRVDQPQRAVPRRYADYRHRAGASARVGQSGRALAAAIRRSPTPGWSISRG